MTASPRRSPSARGAPGRLAALAAAVLAVACRAPGPGAQGDDATSASNGLAGLATATALLGTWRWVHVLDEPSLRRLETEEWQWSPSPRFGALLRGRYLREVTVRSRALPFACNQDLVYRQRAVFEVEARAVGGELRIVETGYRTEPSPCDHGFRRLGSYRVSVHRGRADLAFAEGRQSLWQVDDHLRPLAEPPWERVAATAAGPWQWSNDTVDDQGLLRHEDERWDVAVSSPPAQALTSPASAPGADVETLDAVYVRRVTIRSPDGAVIPCAEAPSYGFEDRYVLAGKRQGAVLAVRETAVAAASHRCLREHAARTLDTGVLEVLGPHLVIDWRGNRRQVLHRPR